MARAEYQYSTSPRKLEPEYRIAKKKAKVKSSRRFTKTRSKSI